MNLLYEKMWNIFVIVKQINLYNYQKWFLIMCSINML